MTKKIKDLVVAVGKYEVGGKSKNKYINVGAVFQKNDGGEFMVLNRTFCPAGVPNPDNRDTVIISSFDVKDGAGNAAETHKGFDSQGDVAKAIDDQEIPF